MLHNTLHNMMIGTMCVDGLIPLLGINFSGFSSLDSATGFCFSVLVCTEQGRVLFVYILGY